MAVFDFCPNSRVTVELPPEEPSIMSMNGWHFTSKPKIPYRPSFKVTLYGLRWYLTRNDTRLDLTYDPEHNAGRLLHFYRDHRLWRSFSFTHDFFGNIDAKFKRPVTVPAGDPDAFGIIKSLEIELIQENVSWN